jgi:hypothetical protein
LFDIGPIRVHEYPRANLPAARAIVAGLIRDRLSAIDLTKSLLVDRALRALDPNALSMLLTRVPMVGDTFDVNLPILPQQMMGKLFDLGILAFAYDAITAETIAQVRSSRSVAPLQKVRVTAFGKAVLQRIPGCGGDA